MNIFYIDTDPVISAQYMVDRHVVKMILETAQLLSTAHRILDGNEYIGQSATGRKVKRFRLNDLRDNVLYSATHINHPSAIWARDSVANYEWLYNHFVGLLLEYQYRYGKFHKCGNAAMLGMLSNTPNNIKIKEFTPPTPAMSEEYMRTTSLDSYRNYYIHGKKHLHKYTKRSAPSWLNIT